MATIQLMRINTISQVVNKNPTLINNITGNFKEPFELMTPSVKIEMVNSIGDLIRTGAVNYIKFEDKFYYINSWSIENNQFMILNLKIDVLMTYKTEFNKATVILDRSSSPSTQYINDPMLPTSTEFEFETIEFPNGFSEKEEDGVYLLVTAQKGYTTT